MTESFTFTLKDGEKTCEMEFLNLEYLQAYFKNIDITKVKVHEVLDKKIYFSYDGNSYQSCPLYKFHDYYQAIIDVKAFVILMLSFNVLWQIHQDND